MQWHESVYRRKIPSTIANFLRLTAIAIALCFFAIAPLSADTQDLPAPERFKIALLLPLSGPQAELGKALQNAAIMGLFRSNMPNLAIVPYDTGGRADQAVLAAERAIAEGTQAILGPLFGSETQAIAKIAADAHIPILSFSNDWNIAGGAVFILGLTPQTEVAQALDYIESRGVRILHVLSPDNAYGKAVVDAAKFKSARGTIKLQTLASYAPNNPKSIKDAVLKIQSALPPSGDASLLAYHAILIGDSGSKLSAINAEFGNAGISGDKIALAGTSPWSDLNFANWPNLQNALWAGIYPDTLAQFETTYQSFFGAAPPRLSVLGFDGMMILAPALMASIAAPASIDDKVNEVLRQAPQFQTAAGLLRFGAAQLAERRLSIVRATADGVLPQN